MECNENTINSNMGLVHACAKRFRGRGIEYDDLIGAGSMGLVKAIKAFDHDRGVCFSTYAVPVILGEMKRLFRDGGIVKIGRSLKELSLKATKAREILSKELGREPLISEVAQKLDVSIEAATEAVSASLPPLSLTYNEDEGGGQIDVPIDPPEEAIADKIALKEVVSSLEAKDRTLIVMRYFKSQTQAQTAKVLGMTQVQVSRREKVILGEMRRRLTG